MDAKIDDVYADCTHLKWSKPTAEVDEELSKEILQSFRTLPTFETTVFQRKYIKHYSLERHELLKCRWKQYRAKIEDRVHAPFAFPNNRDLHFYNGSIRFMPILSIHRYPEHRLKLKPGPGVDVLGQVPIPCDMMMKRETKKSPYKFGKLNKM